MNILARYTLKYLWLNKKRSGVTILGVILSSALICGVILLGFSFQKMMIDRAISYMGNIHAMFMNVPVEKAGYIANNNAVEISMLRTSQTGSILGYENPGRPYLFLSAYDRQAMIDLPIELISGRLPQDDHEIVISQMIVSQSGGSLALGSQVHVELGQRTLPGGEVLALYYPLEEGEVFVPSHEAAYTIVGTIAPTFEEQIFDYPGYLAITYLAPENLPAFEFVDVAIRVRNPFALYQNVNQIAANAGFAIFGEFNSSDDAVIVNYNDDMLQWMGVNDNSQYLMFFVSVLGFMIALVVVGSGLVIFNTFSISISERKKQFGVFASTGATTGQIHRAVMMEALVIGLVGIPLGILGGIVGVGITLAYVENIFRQLMDMEMGMQLVVSLPMILLTILFTGATILLSAWIPAQRAARVSPIDAIRLSGDIQDKAPKKLFSSPWVRRILGFEGELALKSIQRDRKRFRATVFSLMISIILFVTFNAMMEYGNTTARLNNQAESYNLGLYLSGGLKENERFVKEAIQLPQVQAYSHRRCLSGKSDQAGKKITGEAVQAFTELGWQYLEDGKPVIQIELCAFGQPEFERYLQSLGLTAADYGDQNPLKAILVNRNEIRMNKLYEFDLIRIHSGDTLDIAFYSHTEENTLIQLPVTIGAVVPTVPLGAYQPSQGLLLVVSDAAFTSALQQLGVEDLGPGELFFETSDVVALTTEVKQRYEAIVGEELFYTSPYEQNQRGQLMEIVINLFFYGFLTLITLVGITNIINTIDTNLHLRRREFAMLKSVGLTPRGFRKVLRFESLFYGLTALVLGLPVAIALSAVLFNQFSGITSFAFTLPWKPMLICTLGVLVIVQVTMMASGARMNNDNIIDTIREENQ